MPARAETMAQIDLLPSGVRAVILDLIGAAANNNEGRPVAERLQPLVGLLNTATGCRGDARAFAAAIVAMRAEVERLAVER